MTTRIHSFATRSRGVCYVLQGSNRPSLATSRTLYYKYLHHHIDYLTTTL